MNSKIFAAASLVTFLGIGTAAPSASAAFMYCSEPRAPSIYVSKPTKPYCAATRSCEQWEVDMYRNQVRSYFSSLQQYADEVDDYYRDASDYIECMSDLD